MNDDVREAAGRAILADPGPPDWRTWALCLTTRLHELEHGGDARHPFRDCQELHCRLTTALAARPEAGEAARLREALAPIMAYLNEVDRMADPDGHRQSDKLAGANDTWLLRSDIARLRAALAPSPAPQEAARLREAISNLRSALWRYVALDGECTCLQCEEEPLREVCCPACLYCHGRVVLAEPAFRALSPAPATAPCATRLVGGPCILDAGHEGGHTAGGA